MPVRVSAAMIVRDEEGFLGDCLASLAGHVDEIVVVDTGSKDRTLEIAGAYGARVFSIPWPDDFSAARNVSVEHATGDWILWIDADDRLRVPKGVSLPALLDDPKAAGATVTMQWRSDATACRELRLFRNDPRIRFAGIIYENVLESLDVVCRAEGLVIRDTPLRIDHLGYETDLTPKHRRNLALLRRAVAERPDQPFYWSRLGESLAALGEVAEAIEACRTAIELAPNLGPGIERGELAFAYQTLARLLAEAGEPVEKVLDTIDQGLRWRPDDYALSFARARALIEARRPKEALAILDRLAAIDPDSVRPHSTGYDRRLFGEFAHDLRGVALLRLGRYDEAAAAFEKAAVAAPDNLAYRTKAAAMRGQAARAPTS